MKTITLTISSKDYTVRLEDDFYVAFEQDWREILGGKRFLEPKDLLNAFVKKSFDAYSNEVALKELCKNISSVTGTLQSNKSNDTAENSENSELKSANDDSSGADVKNSRGFGADFSADKFLDFKSYENTSNWGKNGGLLDDSWDKMSSTSADYDMIGSEQVSKIDDCTDKGKQDSVAFQDSFDLQSPEISPHLKTQSEQLQNLNPKSAPAQEAQSAQHAHNAYENGKPEQIADDAPKNLDKSDENSINLSQSYEPLSQIDILSDKYVKMPDDPISLVSLGHKGVRVTLPLSNTAPLTSECVANTPLSDLSKADERSMTHIDLLSQKKDKFFGDFFKNLSGKESD